MTAASDFWNHPYYKLAKIVTSVAGQWPYQSKGKRTAIAIVTFSIIYCQVISQVAAAWVNRDNYEIVFDALTPLLIDVALLTKYINNCFHTKTMINLLGQMKYNWNIFPKNNGLHMLHHHSAFGNEFSKIYMVAIWLSITSYVTEPMQERLTIHFLSPNVTLPKRFSLPLEFGPIDVDTWYYYLWFGSALADVMRMTAVGGTDLLLFIFAEHVCGVLKALGYAIENLPSYDESDTYDESFPYMRSCAIIHSHAIDFAEHVRDTYIWSFFGVIGVNMVLISLTGVQAVINLDDTEKLVKFCISIMAQMMHLFAECFIAQQVMDASFELKDTITNAKWYNTSQKTQKLIPLMLMRAQNPIVLTAGKIMVMNMDTYAVVLKTAASYFTVFLAMQ